MKTFGTRKLYHVRVYSLTKLQSIYVCRTPVAYSPHRTIWIFVSYFMHRKDRVDSSYRTFASFRKFIVEP